ncbi:MAG: peptidase S10 [Acidobacteria bacterium]|nr:MAG: peptidase S10 [Acidobacteriota bacterium]
MKSKFTLSLLALAVAATLPTFAQQTRPARNRRPNSQNSSQATAQTNAQPKTPTPAPEATPAPGRGNQMYGFEPEATDPPPVKTHHSVTIDGKTYQYTAEVGKMPIADASGKTMGHMFYVAYLVDNPDPSHPRPVTISYNGGPGYASVWVHVGGFGPRRVALNDNGSVPPPPYKLVNNADSWLDATDLVFVDAVGTGYSRATDLKNLKAATNAQGDLEAFAQFIRMWMYQNNRLNSPLILAGESYGTFRSAGLSNVLWQHHIPVTGIVLLSSVLNFDTLRPSYSNDRPYWLMLPTQTAIAWHYHKLAPQYQKETLPEAVKQSEEWAETNYQHYLDLGDALQGAPRQQALKEMSALTGLSPQFLDGWNLRISTALFDSSLLRDRRKIIGRYDGTQIGTNRTPGDIRPDYDASSDLDTAYQHEFVEYLRNNLDYRSTLEYGQYGLGGSGFPGWSYNISSGGRFGRGSSGPGNANDDVSQDLERAFAQDPSLRVMLCEGYFDQATPMLEATYSMRHLFITPAEQTHISIEHYESGHMIYAIKGTREKLHRDFDAFVRSVTGAGQ